MKCTLIPFLLLTAVLQRSGQPDIKISDLEQRVHVLVNKERAGRKLAELRFDDKLARIARTHSQDMARRNFFDHVNPDGQDPTARGEAAGYTCEKVSGDFVTVGLAENIFQGNLYRRVRTVGTQKSYDWNSADEIAAESITGWMNSPGHRRNILETTYIKTGIGIAIARDDKVYITQVFC